MSVAAERRALEAALSVDQLARLDRFVLAEDAWQYIAAHTLLRRTLSRCAPVAPEAWSYGSLSGERPEIEAPSFARRLRFSLSHTRGLAACAVCLDHAVGVDAEAIEEALVPAEVEREVLAPAEAEALAPLAGRARIERMFTLWTLKEACLKARGEGLAEPPSALSFTLGGGDPTVSFLPPLVDDPAAWRLHAELLPSGHALALAVRCPRGEPLRVRVEED